MSIRSAIHRDSKRARRRAVCPSATTNTLYEPATVFVSADIRAERSVVARDVHSSTFLEAHANRIDATTVSPQRSFTEF
jgi:hypothetical protein